MKCIKCKKEIAENSVFCNWCGKKQTVTKNKSRKRANGQGSVYKLSGNRNKPFVAVLPASYNATTGDKKQTILGYYESKTAALNALNERISKGVTDRVSMTLQQIYDEWSEQHYKKISDSTIRSYKLTWTYLDKLKNKKMADIRANDVQNACSELSHSSMKMVKTLYSLLCRYAMSLDIIYQDYSKFVVLPAYEKNVRRALTVDEIKKIKALADTSDIRAMAVMILIFTGLRVTEFVTLKHEQVFIDDNYFRAGIKTEAGKDRVIPIHPIIKPYFEYFYSTNKGYIFKNRLGRTITGVGFNNTIFKKLCEELKIEDVSVHCTRHTFATLLQDCGVVAEDSIKIMGHSDYKTTTDIYIHQSVEKLQKAIEKIEI